MINLPFHRTLSLRVVSLQVLDATGAGVDATGAGVDTTGDGVDATGAGVDATGAGVDVTGAGVDTIGAGVDTTGAGVDATGAGVDATVSHLHAFLYFSCSSSHLEAPIPAKTFTSTSILAQYSDVPSTKFTF
eukprot:CAMPEP_0203639006 /NCGR_PEP_ID=MMETSP0088-20131115/4867_1 /ASSEMBLY_ACC=CAM_ASM_001087 /TAXON_ID=426623 /ORGANISM="Chaetoceros affinis, Strain CCMP159" /LENGTH=131 /DNA_ID=CAMNT_0050493771 /DNA_START=151 /DNA_END=546 /DNA_ORIENTATION=-